MASGVLFPAQPEHLLILAPPALDPGVQVVELAATDHSLDTDRVRCPQRRP